VMRGNKSYRTAVRFVHSSEEKGDGQRRSAAARERAAALGHCPEKEEGEGHRVGHGPKWPGWPNATWAGAERKQRRKWNGPQG
jgi:hypothetical protein